MFVFPKGFDAEEVEILMNKPRRERLRLFTLFKTVLKLHVHTQTQSEK